MNTEKPREVLVVDLDGVLRHFLGIKALDIIPRLVRDWTNPVLNFGVGKLVYRMSTPDLEIVSILRNISRQGTRVILITFIRHRHRALVRSWLSKAGINSCWELHLPEDEEDAISFKKRVCTNFPNTKVTVIDDNPSIRGVLAENDVDAISPEDFLAHKKKKTQVAPRP